MFGRGMRACAVMLALGGCAARADGAAAPGPPRGEPRDAPASATPGSAAPARGLECGDLVLERVALRTRGAGERHPRRVEVERAILVACADEPGKASLVEACQRLRRERVEAQSAGYGPMHPRMRAIDAQLAVCPSLEDGAPAPATTADCASLRAEREALASAGKGERHPLVVAVNAKLEACK